MDHGGMDMGSDAACKVSMLWNWYTVDACFLSSTWHVRSGQGFAGSCIGVVALVVTLAALRRLQKAYDQHLVVKARRLAGAGMMAALPEKGYRDSEQTSVNDFGKDTEEDVIEPSAGKCSSVLATSKSCCASKPPPPTLPHPALLSSSLRPRQAHSRQPVRQTIGQQAIHSLIYTAQFAVAYFVMLLAMYFNGYIIISIFVGVFVGEMIFGWDLSGMNTGLLEEEKSSTGCCH